MAEYYSNSISRSKRRKRWSYSRKELLLLALDLFMTLAMALLVFCSISIIACQYISPEKSGILSILSLGAPIIYLLDLVVMFYWIVRWRWLRALVMVAIVVVGLFYVSRYYKMNFDRQYNVTYDEREYTKVMTYNVKVGKTPELAAYIAKLNPDVLCVQEIATCGESWDALEEKYHTTKQPMKEGDESSDNQILSKYPILRKGGIEDLPSKSGMWADLKIEDDTVRVISLHLQSTSISPEDTRFIESHEYLHDKERDNKVRSITARLVENNISRAQQAERVAKFLSETPYKTIVCGDFNDVPLSYTYHTIAKNLDDTFSQMANGFAYTYKTKYRLLRIDHIMVSPSIKVASYEVDNKVEISDHYPVISRIRVGTNK